MEKEDEIWQIYNTLTEIEATFRVLKTDLHLRPIYHQKDKSSDAHIFLGILAYTLVNTIRYQLKQKDINYDWKNIVSPYGEAGATWWIESMWGSQNEENLRELLLERIHQGPPKILD